MSLHGTWELGKGLSFLCCIDSRKVSNEQGKKEGCVRMVEWLERRNMERGSVDGSRHTLLHGFTLMPVASSGEGKLRSSILLLLLFFYCFTVSDFDDDTFFFIS